MTHYFNAWKKFADFHGRARRTEYWLFVILNAIPSFFLYMFLNFTDFDAISDFQTIVLFLISLFFLLFALIAAIPYWAVTVRRLHDTGHSGWFYFLGLIPIVGGVVVLIFLLQDSQHGDNQYGPEPKQVSEEIIYR